MCFYKLKFGVKYFKIEFGAFFKSNGVIFSFKKVWCTILYNLVESCVQFYTQFQSGKVYLKFDGVFFACLFEFIAKVASSFPGLHQWEITYLKNLEGKLLLFCSPQRRTENKMK